MQSLVIEGGKRLSGEITLQGSKNSALPILAASLLSDGVSEINNCPSLSDIYAACRILSHLGCRCKAENKTITVDARIVDKTEVPQLLMHKMRSSIIFMGAILGRLGECRLSFPGGCELGPRPIDIHLTALRKMGVTIKEDHGVLDCKVEKELCGAKIMLPFPSVGATENIILAAVLAKGETEIRNAAREPEIADLAKYLNSCGARVRGAGTGTIIITGVPVLTGSIYKVMPDRIVAATYMCAAAITGGEININCICIEDIDSIIPVFEEMGCYMYSYSDNLYLSGKKQLKAVKKIITMPYPGFPTDAQPMIMATLCKAKGTSMFIENIFENRYKHASELIKMGADIKSEGKVAIVEGVGTLYGTSLTAPDLRGGAALVLAGLAAEGVTTVTDIYHIDRGYDEIETILCSVGGNVIRKIED